MLLALTVIILTQRRIESFRRLLDSVNVAADHLSGAVNLYISCDVSSSNEIREVLDSTVAEWRHGTAKVSYATQRLSVVGQWFGCWDGAGRPERFVILEDDLELSPFALSWLTGAYDRYPDAVGFSLQRQTNCFDMEHCVSDKLSLPWDVVEYRYKLVGTWGYAPVARHWEEFLQWIGDLRRNNPDYVPRKSEFLPSKWYEHFYKNGRSDSMWSMWFIHYCDTHPGLYTIYYHHPTDHTLATNRMEPGEHFGSGDGNWLDFPPLANAPLEPLLRGEGLPLALNWDGNVDYTAVELAELSALKRAAKTVSANGNTPLITFVNYAFRGMLEHYLCNLEYAAPHRIEQLIVVCMDGAMLAHVAGISDKWTFTFTPLGGALTEQRAQVLYSTLSYYRMIEVRTRALAELLRQGTEFMLVECDVVFWDDFVVDFEASDGDIVGIQDDEWKDSQYLNGGYLLFRPNPNVLEVWDEVSKQFSKNLQKATSNNSAGTALVAIANEQDIFSQLISEKTYNISATVLAPTLFMSGQAFLRYPLEHQRFRSGKLVLLNWAVGNERKKRRAHALAMWFSLDAGYCVREGTECELKKYGGRESDGYGAWYLCSGLLKQSSAPLLIWSFGVGGDISFERDVLLGHPSAEVVCFDPTIDEISFWSLVTREQIDPGRIGFRSIGLGATSGSVTFYKSTDQRIKSLSTVPVKGYVEHRRANVKTLEDILADEGTERLDVLKIDIEGEEYSVVDAWKRPPHVRQLAVKYHKRFFGHEVPNVENKLLGWGYHRQHVSNTDDEVLYVMHL